MKAYQCSRCQLLRDYDEYCACLVLGDVRPNRREVGNAKKCKEIFFPLSEKETWHEKFSWEVQND